MASMEDLVNEILAGRELEREGSVMASQGDPGFGLPTVERARYGLGKLFARAKELRGQLGGLEKGEVGDELLSTILDLTPAGMLGPIGKRAFGEGMTKQDKGLATLFDRAQKKIAKAIFRGDPQILKEAEAVPDRMLHLMPPLRQQFKDLSQADFERVLDDFLGGGFAAHSTMGRGTVSNIAVDPEVMKGRLPSRIARRFRMSREATGATGPMAGSTPRLVKDLGAEGLPAMGTHEVRHFLSNPEITAIEKFEDVLGGTAAEAAESLIPFLGHARYGKGIVQDWLREQMPGSALSEAYSYLSQAERRSPEAEWLADAIFGRAAGKPLPQNLPLDVLRQLRKALHNVGEMKRRVDPYLRAR